MHQLSKVRENAVQCAAVLFCYIYILF